LVALLADSATTAWQRSARFEERAKRTTYPAYFPVCCPVLEAGQASSGSSSPQILGSVRSMPAQNNNTWRTLECIRKIKPRLMKWVLVHYLALK